MSYLPSFNWNHDVGAGKISGSYWVNKFGANDAFTTEEDVWINGGTYPWPTAAETVRVKAGGNAADTAAGAGARKVMVQGLDENWADTTEEITLAGASASSATTTTFIRVYRAWVTDSGTYTGANTGAVVIENTSSAQVLANIAAGKGQSQLSMFTIPAGKVGTLYGGTANVASAKPADMFFWQRQNADTVAAPFTGKRLVFPIYQLEGTVHIPLELAGTQFPAKTDVWCSGIAVSAATGLSVHYTLLISNA